MSREEERFSPLVSRVLAPNPSTSTLTGTNTFLIGEAEVAVVPLSVFAERNPPRGLVRLCFGKKDETIDAGVAAMAKAKEIMA